MRLLTLLSKRRNGGFISVCPPLLPIIQVIIVVVVVVIAWLIISAIISLVNKPARQLPPEDGLKSPPAIHALPFEQEEPEDEYSL